MVNLASRLFATSRRCCTILSIVLATILVSSIVAATWGLHGLLTDHLAPTAPGDQSKSGFLVSVFTANTGAVAIAASGVLTFGIGTLTLAPLVAANIGILLGAGQEWLSPEAFHYGLIIHGTGEVLAVILGTAAGLHPALRTIPGLQEQSLKGNFISRYIHGVTETVPYLAAAAIILIVSAFWETFISATLI